MHKPGHNEMPESGSQKKDQTTSREIQEKGKAGLEKREAYHYAPFAFMRRFSDEMDRLFQDFGFGRSGFFTDEALSAGSTPSLWYPQIETLRKNGKMLVRVDLPGMKKEDIKIEVADNALYIEGERKNEREENTEGFYRSERSYGRFYRTIPLPEGVKAADAKAHFENGVLELEVPVTKKEENKRRIEIK